MELRELRHFLTVADELHFGRAAERLHIVQSAVSAQVRKLERELGADLFDRTTRRVRLTAAGRLLVPYAREMLAVERAARAAVDELRATEAGRVRLGTSDGLGARLDAVLAAFARQAPGAQLELVTATTDDRLALVRAGELDATLLRGEREASGLEFIPLWEDPVVLALPATHALARSAGVDLAALAALPLRLASHERNPALHDLVVGACEQAGFRPDFGPEFTTAQDTLATIAYGRLPSWTVMYEPHAEQLPVLGIAFSRPRNPSPAMPTYLAVRPDPPSAGLRALLAACEEACRDTPRTDTPRMP